jgi:hypothetical protein
LRQNREKIISENAIYPLFDLLESKKVSFIVFFSAFLGPDLQHLYLSLSARHLERGVLLQEMGERGGDVELVRVGMGPILLQLLYSSRPKADGEKNNLGDKGSI